MAKDPAFLFYPGDWLGGTMGMTFEQKGCYFELLMLQFNSGKFTEQQAKQLLGFSFQTSWKFIKTKFETDGAYFWNIKLDAEKLKRKEFTASRRNNLHKSTHMGNHKAELMENENENRNISGIEDRKAKFINDVGLFRNKYDVSLLAKFAQYWIEHNPKGKKMRFEMEKVFDINRRLSTWKSNDNKFSKHGKKQVTDEDLAEALKRDFSKSS